MSVPGPPASGTHPLDGPARASLTGAHAHLAERRGRVLRYPVDVSPFLAMPERPSAQHWDDLAALSGPGTVVPLAGVVTPPPAGWAVVMDGVGVHVVDAGVAAAPDEEAVRLTPADVPEMLALVGRTRPGPFLPRALEMGAYLGIRPRGELVAMAGERLHPPGWTEVSASCTDASCRGQGLATRLVHAVVHGIRGRGESAFLHAAATNTGATRLYASLDVRLRRTTSFRAARVPRRPDAGAGPTAARRARSCDRSAAVTFLGHHEGRTAPPGTAPLDTAPPRDGDV